MKTSSPQDSNVMDTLNNTPYLIAYRYSLDEIVFSATLWGGPGIDMSWLDGMTGCTGECNIADSSVTFSNFFIGDSPIGQNYKK